MRLHDVTPHHFSVLAFTVSGVLQRRIPLPAGQTSYPLNISTLSKGTFAVQIKSDAASMAGSTLIRRRRRQDATKQPSGWRQTPTDVIACTKVRLPKHTDCWAFMPVNDWNSVSLAGKSPCGKTFSTRLQTWQAPEDSWGDSLGTTSNDILRKGIHSTTSDTNSYVFVSKNILINRYFAKTITFRYCRTIKLFIPLQRTKVQT